MGIKEELGKKIITDVNIIGEIVVIIAAAYGIPAIVIFGAIMPETSCPRGSEVLCISHECDCKPCTLDDCPNGTYECLEKIDTAEINLHTCKAFLHKFQTMGKFINSLCKTFSFFF